MKRISVDDNARLRICLDLFEWASHPFRGLGQYERNLSKALITQDKCEFMGLAPNSFSKQGEQSQNIQMKLFQWPLSLKQRKGLWLLSNRLQFPLDRAFKGVDVFHALDFIGPWLREIPLVITVHDMAPWLWRESRTLINKRYFDWAFPITVARADRIIVDTESTQNDLCQLWPQVEKNVRVVYLAHSEKYSTHKNPELFKGLSEKLDLRSAYYLAVGTLEPRKNYSLMLRAFHQLIEQEQSQIPDIKLVIVGKPGWLYKSIYKQIVDLGLSDKVVLANSFTDEELCQLYVHCLAYVITSKYEGFGLPVLEAMASGAPVISSNAAALREVGGDAAMVFDLTDPDSLVDCMRAMLDPGCRQDYRGRGLKRVKDFSWRKTAEQTRKIYLEAYESHKS